ncbi:MAG: hypothetical protein LBI82_05835 [Dysgonamonadaceae bacterium]|jgi:hypothetical protein|nr:hypothetical protein [Dysgonamonadaceae bacterium]
MKMNLLKLLGLFLVLGLSTAVFYSCNKNDDDDDNGGSSGNASRITATNVINGSTQITTVKAFADWYGYGWREDVIAQAQYKNNGFTLELPETLSAKYLEEIDEIEEFSVSDKNAKIYLFEDIRGYDKFENEIGYFYLGEENDDSSHYTYSSHYACWMYADGDVTIVGEYKYIDEYYNYKYDDYEYDDYTNRRDLRLKKGWNVVYESYIQNYKNGRYVRTFTLTSQKPSGVNYSWVFYDDYDLRSAKATTKSVKNIKSIFSKSKKDRKK